MNRKIKDSALKVREGLGSGVLSTSFMVTGYFLLCYRPGF